jgi:GAG-pre-integrase domain
MPILHIGSSVLSFANNSLRLNNVLHVPSFIKNLLSISQLLTDNNLLIEFSPTLCIIKDRLTLSPLLQAKHHSGLYSLHLPSAQPKQAYLGARLSADLWHARLGHPSSTTTLHVLNSFHLPCSSKILSLCHDCCMSKSHKLPFSLSTSSTTSPLTLIHSDLWGPAPIVSKDGFRYYVIFVDDYTRFTWIYFSKQKMN